MVEAVLIVLSTILSYPLTYQAELCAVDEWMESVHMPVKIFAQRGTLIREIYQNKSMQVFTINGAGPTI